MERYLVWRKDNLVGFCNFEFYSEKVAVIIIDQ